LSPIRAGVGGDGESTERGFAAWSRGWDAAGRLVEHFMNAGLPCPKLFAESLVDGGEDSPFYKWLAETARSLLSRAIESGEVSAQEIAIDTLADRMKAEVVQARGQLEVASQVCARVRP
jgi:hypothetical protein